MLILLLFLYLKIRYAPLILEFLDVSTKQYQILKLLTNTSTYSIQISTPELIVKGDFISSTGVSILTCYGENPHYVKLPIFSEFMENSAKFMKNSGLTKWTQNLR